MRKIIIAGGGTGGHIFPAIAIANAVRQLDPACDILFVGAKGKMEMEKVPQAGYRIEGIDIAGFNRSSLLKNLSLPFKLLKSFLQVRRIVNRFEPDAVVGVGGYSSFPVLRYAQGRGIPSFVHESNSFAGRANIWLGKKATRVFVANEGMEKFFPAGKILVTGNPVRKEIVERRTERGEALRHFGLDPAKTTVLAIGGSLGARSINEALAAGLDRLQGAGLQLIWQTGKTTSAQFLRKAEGRSDVWAGAFITDMSLAYAAADIVISRAGAMSVAELCVTGKPAVFVPFPFAAEDHQTVNAQYLVDRQAAILVKDAEAAGRLVDEVLALAADTARQQSMRQHISSLAITNADEVIAQEILKHIK